MSRADKRRRKGPKFMRIGKHEKPSDENIRALLTPSVLNIMLCMVCLAGMTWAWFSADSTAAVSRIEAAETFANATVMIGGGATAVDNADDTESSDAYVVSENADGTYSLTAGTLYTVLLDMQGSAANGGYCVISGEGETYYTPHLMPNDEFIFYICPNADSVYRITSSWGELPSGINILSYGDLIGTEPAANTEPATSEEANEQEQNSQQTGTSLPPQNPTDIDENNSAADNYGQAGDGEQTGSADNSGENTGDNTVGENIEGGEHNSNDGQNDVLSGENKGSENSNTDTESENTASGDSDTGATPSGGAGDNPSTAAEPQNKGGTEEEAN